MALFELNNLTVRFDTPDGAVEAVRGLSESLQAGEALAFVGESGSGKSQTLLGAFGLLAENGSTEGRALLEGADLLAMTPVQRRARLGRDVGFVFQDPLTSLTPHMTVARQISEPLMLHKGLSRAEARAEALRLLTQVQLTSPEMRLDQYPHELSGGMRQRVMIAMAIACKPRLLIADEPTTALDVTVQAEILALLRGLQKEIGMGLIFVTHDLAVAGAIADRIVVLQNGQVVERGESRALLQAPTTVYAQALVAAARPQPRTAAQAEHGSGDVLASVQDLHVAYPAGGLWRKRYTPVLHGVSLEVERGECLGLVGESGSGKSTLIRAILGLVPARTGTISFDGKPILPPYPPALRRRMQLVFQDPFAALNPRRTVGESIAEPLEIFEPDLSRAQRRDMVADMLGQVDLPAAFANRYPHELSGGQNQRVNIARALIVRPELLVADEAVSALDAHTKLAVLDLLDDLKARFGLTILFVTHDMASVARLCDRVAVLNAGRLVELGPTARVFSAAQDAYTRRLIAAVPSGDPDRDRARLDAIAG